ncbi:PQQ-binding-like beta-propeller repeat protein [Streptomyces pratensis]|uniref:outer membrane protein assembly factor BamB family protein n=1 Tax=Streptomyces pratensis TaxID=1169025 RepID=UPI00301A2933
MTHPPSGSSGEQQGAFGAPYEPLPGAYGDPSPDRPRPGAHGHQGAYGHPRPQAPAGAYGQQLPPTAPPGLPPPPGPGGGGRSGRRAAGLVAAVIAAALVVGAGVWFAAGGDAEDPGPVAAGPGTALPQSEEATDPKAQPSPGARELNEERREGEAPVRWIQRNGVDLPAGGASAFGPWTAGGLVAKALYRTASGYSLADGSRKWSLRLPADVCAAPTLPTTDGKIVLGLRSDTTEEASCDRLQMIDLTTGKAGWTATFERAGTQDALSDIVMAVNGDVVTVGRTTLTDAYRISDGEHLWGELPGACQPYGLTSGAVPLAAVDCREQPVDEAEQEVRRVDPATGRTVWSYKVKKGWEVDQFYSVDPPVVSLRQSDKWAIALLGDDGVLRAQPDPGTDDYEARCADDQRNEGGNLDNCVGVAADSDTLYLATKAAPVDKEPTNAVVAFDMGTGKRKWKVPAPAAQTLMPLRVEDGNVLMYLSPPAPGGGGGGIMALGPQGGGLRPVLRHPASAATVERTFHEPLVQYADGRSLLMHAYVTGPTDEEEITLRTMIAFGD